MSSTHNSSSQAQQEAEKEMLENFVKEHHLYDYTPPFPPDFQIQIDGKYKNESGKHIWVEVYARQGKLHGSQSDKICSDMLKLITAQKVLDLVDDELEKYILLGSEEAKISFNGKSWPSKVAKEFSIHIEVGKLSPETIEKLKAAQTRQTLGNSKITQ